MQENCCGILRFIKNLKSPFRDILESVIHYNEMYDQLMAKPSCHKVPIQVIVGDIFIFGPCKRIAAEDYIIWKNEKSHCRGII